MEPGTSASTAGPSSSKASTLAKTGGAGNGIGAVEVMGSSVVTRPQSDLLDECSDKINETRFAIDGLHTLYKACVGSTGQQHQTALCNFMDWILTNTKSLSQRWAWILLKSFGLKLFDFMHHRNPQIRAKAHFTFRTLVKKCNLRYLGEKHVKKAFIDDILARCIKLLPQNGALVQIGVVLDLYTAIIQNVGLRSGQATSMLDKMFDFVFYTILKNYDCMEESQLLSVYRLIDALIMHCFESILLKNSISSTKFIIMFRTIQLGLKHSLEKISLWGLKLLLSLLDKISILDMEDEFYAVYHPHLLSTIIELVTNPKHYCYTSGFKLYTKIFLRVVRVAELGLVVHGFGRSVCYEVNCPFRPTSVLVEKELENQILKCLPYINKKRVQLTMRLLYSTQGSLLETSNILKDFMRHAKRRNAKEESAASLADFTTFVRQRTNRGIHLSPESMAIIKLEPSDLPPGFNLVENENEDAAPEVVEVLEDEK